MDTSTNMISGNYSSPENDLNKLNNWRLANHMVLQEDKGRILYIKKMGK